MTWGDRREQEIKDGLRAPDGQWLGTAEDWAPKPGIYRHFKGGMYYVQGVGRHTETEEKMVVYYNSAGEMNIRPLEGLKGWITEEVNHKMPDGTQYTGPRFEFMGRVR